MHPVILKTRSLNSFCLFQDVKSNDGVELEIWARQTQLENFISRAVFGECDQDYLPYILKIV